MTDSEDFFLIVALCILFIFATVILFFMFLEDYHRRKDRLEGCKSVVSSDPEYYAAKYDTHYVKKTEKTGDND